MAENEVTNEQLIAAARMLPDQLRMALHEAQDTGDATFAGLIFRTINVVHDTLYHRGMISAARILFLRTNNAVTAATGQPIMSAEDYGNKYPIQPSEDNEVEGLPN